MAFRGLSAFTADRVSSFVIEGNSAVIYGPGGHTLVRLYQGVPYRPDEFEDRCMDGTDPEVVDVASAIEQAFGWGNVGRLRVTVERIGD